MNHTPTPSAYRSAIMADGALAYWRLDEASGATAKDQTGAYPGSYVNAPTLGVAGALTGDPDTAASFNGSSQYVNVPYAAALNPSTFSVEAWVRPTGGAGTYRGIMASRSFPQGWVLYANDSGGWEFWVDNGGSGMLVTSGGTAPVNAWTHLVGTFDGTKVALDANGVLVGTATEGATYQPQTTSPLVLGQSEPSAGLFFPGAIDEPALFTSALTAAQVQHHYSVGTTGH